MARPGSLHREKLEKSIPSSAEEIATLCRSLPGWTVLDGKQGYRISNGFDAAITVSRNLSHGRTMANAHQALKRIGLIGAWEEKLNRDVADAKRKSEEDRRRNEKRLQTALAKSAATIPATPPVITVKDLFVAPSSTPTVKPVVKPAPTVTLEPYTKNEEINWKRAEELLSRPMPTMSDGRTLQQRKINAGWVGDLGRAMFEGRFKTTHQGVALAPEAPHNTGGVIDGQHRLWAIFTEGQKHGEDWTITLSVTYNADPDNFDTFDVAKTRTSATTLHIGGEVNAHLLGSTLKELYVWEKFADNPKEFGDWLRWNRYSPGTDELNALLHRHPDIRNDVRIASPFQSRPLMVAGAAVAVFRYHVRSEAPWTSADPEDPKSGLPLDEFLFRLRHGQASTGISNLDDPAVRLRNWFIDGQHKRTYIGTEKKHAPAREVALLQLVTQWTKWIKGDSSKQIKTVDRQKMILPSLPRRNANLV